LSSPKLDGSVNSTLAETQSIGEPTLTKQTRLGELVEQGAKAMNRT